MKPVYHSWSERLCFATSSYVWPSLTISLTTLTKLLSGHRMCCFSTESDSYGCPKLPGFVPLTQYGGCFGISFNERWSNSSLTSRWMKLRSREQNLATLANHNHWIPTATSIQLSIQSNGCGCACWPSFMAIRQLLYRKQKAKQQRFHFPLSPSFYRFVIGGSHSLFWEIS